MTPTTKLSGASASAVSQLRGALIILNLLLYTICPITANPALLGNRFHGPYFFNSTTGHFPTWPISPSAGSSLRTWTGTFTSGIPLKAVASMNANHEYAHATAWKPMHHGTHRLPNVTALALFFNARHHPTGMTREHANSTIPHEIRITTHRTANITAFVVAVNAKHRSTGISQGSVSSIMLNGTNYAAYTTPSITASPSVFNVTYPPADRTALASDIAMNITAGYHTTHQVANETSISSHLGRHSSLDHHRVIRVHATSESIGSSVSRNSPVMPASSSFYLSQSSSSHSSVSLSDGSRTSVSSSPPSRTPFLLSSSHNRPITSASESLSSDSPVMPASSSLHSAQSSSPHFPESSSDGSRISLSSSSPSRTPFVSLSPHDMTTTSASQSASTTLKSSATPTSSKATYQPSPHDHTDFSMPPGCTTAVLYDDYKVLLIPMKQIQTTRPPAVFSTSSSSSSSSSTTPQASAIDNRVIWIPKPDTNIIDETYKDHTPSANTGAIMLGVALGVFPTMLAISLPFFVFREKRKARAQAKAIDRAVAGTVEDAQVAFEESRNGKWTKRTVDFFGEFWTWFCVENADAEAKRFPSGPGLKIRKIVVSFTHLILGMTVPDHRDRVPRLLLIPFSA